MKTTTMKKIFVSVSLLTSMIAFQNCAGKNFNSTEAQSLSKLEAGQAGESLVLIEENGGAGSSAIDVRSSNGTLGSGLEDILMPGEKKGDKDNKCDRKYVCIVEGPGASQKIAFMNSAILNKAGTPADICMTEQACLKIVSQIMVVKGPERRGFCPDHNPNVVNFSDARMQQLVNALKK